MTKLTIEFDPASKLGQGIVALLVGTGATGTGAPPTPPAPGKAAPGKKKAGKKKAGSAPPPPADEGATQEAVKLKVKELMDAQGRDAAKALLDEFEVGRVSELTEDMFADVILRVDSMLAGEDNGTDDGEDGDVF